MKTGLALLLYLLASCAGLPRPTGVAIVGEWQYADNLKSCRYIFKEDRSFSGEVTVRGQVFSKFTGRWSIADGVILYEYTGDMFGKIPVGTRDRDQLLLVDKNSFVIEAADGNRRRYVRMTR